MINYCINVTRGEHGGGTKFYDFYAFIVTDSSTNSKRIVLIQNWGKIGSIARSTAYKLQGQYKIKKHTNESAAKAVLEAIRISKGNRDIPLGALLTYLKITPKTYL